MDFDSFMKKQVNSLKEQHKNKRKLDVVENEDNKKSKVVKEVDNNKQKNIGEIKEIEHKEFNKEELHNDLEKTETSDELTDNVEKIRPKKITKITISEDYLINPEEIIKDKSKVSLQIRDYITTILKRWQNNPHSDKELYQETIKNLAPLLIKLRKNTLDDTMYPTLSTLIYYLQQEDYSQAEETYMKLSIGNVAWPIGIVAVGIHERKNLSKITGEKEMANIMIDNKTRKWITSVKRLVTFCQNNK